MFRGQYSLVVLLVAVSCFNAPVFAIPDIFDDLHLIDVQPGIGGHEFTVRGSGGYVLRIVKPSRSGEDDQEYTGKLSTKQFRRLERAIKKSRFKAIRLKHNQKGDSDAGPVIRLSVDGKMISKQKRTGDTNRRFDELYGTLLAIINKIGERERSRPSDLDVPVLP